MNKCNTCGKDEKEIVKDGMCLSCAAEVERIIYNVIGCVSCKDFIVFLEDVALDSEYGLSKAKALLNNFTTFLHHVIDTANETQDEKSEELKSAIQQVVRTMKSMMEMSNG